MDALIRKIVIPVDFSPASQRAARFGCGLAHNLGAHVYLIHVIETDAVNGRHATCVDHVYGEAHADIASLAQRLHCGNHLTTEIRVGGVAANIAGAARAYGADMIVMATHGRSGLPHLLFGSVAEEVIRKVTCPVLVMRDSGQVRVHHAAAVRDHQPQEVELCSVGQS
jgi:nucleotide-binding universal stress UspA family protein